MGFGEMIIESIVSGFTKLTEVLYAKAQPILKDGVKAEFVNSIITEDRFQTTEVQDIVKVLRKEMSSSPDTLADIGSDVLEGIIGLVAKLQFQAVAKIDVDADMPHTDAIFIQMAIITDVNLLIALLGIVTEVVSLGQIDKLADEIRSYLDYSGLSQMTSTGYGIILSAGVTPQIQKEVLAKTLPTIFDESLAVKLYFKRFSGYDDTYNNMRQLGYTDEKTTKLINSSWFYPMPTDFIRFAVREVFRNDIVEKYGYDEAFPIDEPVPLEQVPEWLRPNLGVGNPTMRDLIEVGALDEATLRWYWRAHWELPSPTMGYEMLHRKIIDQDELETLLRIQDFAPYWIDKMIGISYSPYTRVDARRMYELGVLNDEEYLLALEEIGYSPEKAQKLLEWTVLRKMSPERDLTRTMIMKSFTTGLKDRVWAMDQLELLGYDPGEAELIVSLKEHEIDEDGLSDQIDLYTLRYVSGLITLEELTGLLDELGLNEASKAKLLSTTQNKKDKQISLPTKTDLLDWLRLGILTEAKFKTRMSQLGFLNDDIELYIIEIRGNEEEI